MRSGLFLLLVLALTAACAPAATTTSTASRDLPAPKVVAMAADDQVTVSVLELFCRSCAEHIISGCRDIYGVTTVDVDRTQKLLTLHFDTRVTSREGVLAAVDGVVASIP